MASGEQPTAPRIRSNVFAYANLVPFVFFALFPFYFMFVTSFKSNAELYNLKSVPFSIQSGAIIDHYTFLFIRTEFFTWIKNSLLVAVVATTASRWSSPSSPATAWRACASVAPAPSARPSSSATSCRRHCSSCRCPRSWCGSASPTPSGRSSLIYPTFLVPFCTWLLMGYFRTIPREVEECALVDGATRMQTLVRIVLPMAIPGIICAVLFSFTLCWNEFTYALTFISQSANKTAVVGVTADLIRGDIYYWGSLMAGARARERADRDRATSSSSTTTCRASRPAP